LFLTSSALAINLGGKDIPKERFIVYLFIGHSNMCGRVDDIDTGTYETHPRVWNYKFDDGTDAWIPAQPPVHRDVSWQRGAGPATPFLKKLAQDYPGYYFGSIQNAHSTVTCQADYRRGRQYYDEIAAAAGQFSGQVTFGGVLVMLGAIEARNQAQSLDFGNQIIAMMGEFRTDLSTPDLPLLINRMTQGTTYWQDVQNCIAQLPSQMTFAGIVPSDGPYKPNDDTHYTWVGQQLWGQAAADLITSNGWLPGPNDDPFAPQIASVEAVDATTVEVVFDEDLDAASAQTAGNYVLSPGATVSGAVLGADLKTVTLTTTAMTPGTIYTLNVDGVQDPAGNTVTGLAKSFTYVFIDIPRTNMALWVKADAGVIRISGNFVPLWADQSGSGNELIRARFANQPQWIDSVINGEPVLRFGGAQDQEVDFMTRMLPAAYTGDSTLFFVFQVSAPGQPVNSSLFSSDTSGGSNASYQIDVDGADPGTLQLYSSNAYPITTTNTNPQLLTVRIAGTGLGFWLSGSGAGSHTIGAAEAKTYTQFGLASNRAMSEFLAFDLAEMLIYQTALPDVDRRATEQYLGAKYGLMQAPAGISVVPTGGLVTTEAGGTDSFTVVLDAAPTADVTIPVSSSNPAEGSVSTSALVFTTADWDQLQAVTVTGQDDAQQDGDVVYQVVLDPATSADARYAGMDPIDVSVVNRDDEGTVNQPPQAVISGPATTNVGILVSYYGGNSTDDGNIVSYAWDFGDGNTDSGEMVSTIWTAAGTYTVILTVTDDGGLTDQATLDVEVQEELEPLVILESPLGGEVWPAGSTQHIRWSTVALSDIRIDFTDDGGDNWSLVDYADTADPFWGDYEWDLPDIESDRCIIMVQGYYFEAPAQSGTFTITRGGIPDGGTPSDNDSGIEGGCNCGSVPPGALGLGLFVLVALRRRRMIG
jgi:MYXO-CTERM domain-containing protein